MADMKRLFFFLPLLFVLVLLPASPKAAHAESSGSGYAVAASDDVWFYSKPSDDGKLFILPHTYYVYVVEKGKDFCAVEYLENSAPYQKIEGYCKTSALTFVNFVPERPYLHYEIMLTYVIEGDTSELFGSDLRTIKVPAIYYGKKISDSGKLSFYVYANGIFDFIPASAELEYERNTDYLAAGNPTEPSASVKGESGLSAGHIVAIVIVCVVAVVVAALLLRGKVTSRGEEVTEF